MLLHFRQLHLNEFAAEIPVVGDAEKQSEGTTHLSDAKLFRDVDCALRGHISILMKRQKMNS